MSDLTLYGAHELGRTRLDEDIAILEGMLIYPSSSNFSKDVCYKYYESIKYGDFCMINLVESIIDHNNSICLRISDRIYENHYPDSYASLCSGEIDEDSLLTEIHDDVFTQIDLEYGCLSREMESHVTQILCDKGLSTLVDTDCDKTLLINDCQNILIKSINIIQVIEAAGSIGVNFGDSMMVVRGAQHCI